MQKKEYILLGFAALLVALYVVCFTDWFRQKVIRIEHSARTAPALSSGRSSSGNVTFSLQGRYRLTSVKVVRLSDYLTNKYAHPLWEVLSKKGSPPIDGFAYGVPLPGMTPASPDAEIQALNSGVTYKLLVEARSARGEHDFELREPRRLRR